MAEYFNNFEEIAKRLQLAQGAAVRKVAFDIEADAKVGAPVDKGFLKNSVYTVTNNSSNYGDAESQARAANPKAAMLPEIAHPTDDQTAMVAVGADYGEAVNNGSAHEWGDIPANPFFTRAVEKNRPKLAPAIVSAIQAALR